MVYIEENVAKHFHKEYVSYMFNCGVCWSSWYDSEQGTRGVGDNPHKADTEQRDGQFAVPVAGALVVARHLVGDHLAVAHKADDDEDVEHEEGEERQEGVDGQVHPRDHILVQELVVGQHGTPGAPARVRYQLCSPEQVPVEQHEPSCQSRCGEFGSSGAAEGGGLQGEPNHNEPLDSDSHDKPGRQVEAEVGEEHEQLAANIGYVQHLVPGPGAHPRLEGTHHQHEGVRDGQHRQVEEGGGVSHLALQHHQEAEDVAQCAHRDDDRQAVQQKPHSQLVHRLLLGTGPATPTSRALRP